MIFGNSAFFFRARSFTLAAAFGVMAFSAPAEALVCSGRIPNPITDVCWSCMEPITIAGSASISVKGKLPDARTDAAPVCSCGSGVNLSVGINISFWEPLRTAEVVRHSWCFPSLGGLKLDPGGIRSSDHGRTPQGFGKNRRTAFWQTHWYQTPWLFVLEALLDNACLEEAPWDLAYLSELDPLWDDSMSSFLLSPDSALFTAGAAFGACAVDCALASAGLSEKTLYWCSGCQGSVFSALRVDGRPDEPAAGLAPDGAPLCDEAFKGRLALVRAREERPVRTVSAAHFRQVGLANAAPLSLPHDGQVFRRLLPAPGAEHFALGKRQDLSLHGRRRRGAPLAKARLLPFGRNGRCSCEVG